MLTPIEFEARNDTVPCSMPVLQPGSIESRAHEAYIRLRVNQLFGDSGGMVNPFNGEGISYAIEVGLHAAEVVDRAFATRRTAHLNACDAALRQSWRGHHELGNAFAELVGNPTVMHV